KPEKVRNYWCPRRVIDLINKIRTAVDSHAQIPGEKAKDGFVRLFLADARSAVRGEVKKAAAARMAKITNDSEWSDLNRVKTLTLEHKMAAARMGFAEMYRALEKVKGFDTLLREGTLPLLRFFSELVLPLRDALRANDRLRIAAILRNVSPLLETVALRASGDRSGRNLEQVRNAVGALATLFTDCKPVFSGGFAAYS
ncbi:MAG TPA: hypothetical protein VMZ27_03055, partial [Candidatus Saccharimonadales bacterium]|nr:hypothetical protein [Candidatus Saccharimonadales bacterium]